MPQPTQTPAKTSVQPSRGFLSRIFGSDEFTPEMQEGIEIARKENPNLAPVKPYGFLSRLVQPKAMGYVSPGNNIYLNPNQVGQSAQDWADTLTHEQTHIDQANRSSLWPTLEFLKKAFSGPSLPYGQRPDEIEAFQAEKERRARMGRPQSPIPSFSGDGSYYIPSDVNLPNEKYKSYGPSSRVNTRGPVTNR